MEELILLTLCAGLFFVLGWLIWKKHKIKLIHEYHHTRVRKEDEQAYTKLMGIAMITMGIGMELTGIIDMLTNREYGWYAFGILFVIAMGIITIDQFKYNGGIF